MILRGVRLLDLNTIEVIFKWIPFKKFLFYSIDMLSRVEPFNFVVMLDRFFCKCEKTKITDEKILQHIFKVTLQLIKRCK